MAAALAGSAKYPGAILIADALNATPLMPVTLDGINFANGAAITSIDE